MKTKALLVLGLMFARIGFSQDTLIFPSGKNVTIGKDYINTITLEHEYKPYYKTIIFEPYSTLTFDFDVEQILLSSDNVIVEGPCQIMVLRHYLPTRIWNPGTTGGAAGPKGDQGQNGAELNFNFSFTVLNGPVFIDNIGMPGRQGCQGSRGNKGRDADCLNEARNGRPGGAGGDGGDGGNGGKINLRYYFSNKLNTEELTFSNLSTYRDYWEYMTKNYLQAPGINTEFLTSNDTTYTYARLSKRNFTFDEIPVLNGKYYNDDIREAIKFIDTTNIPNKFITLKGYNIIKINGARTIVFNTTYFKTHWATNGRMSNLKGGSNVDLFLNYVVGGTKMITEKPYMFDNPGIYYYIEPGEGGPPGIGGDGGPGGKGIKCGVYRRGAGDTGSPGPNGKRNGERGTRFAPSFIQLN